MKISPQISLGQEIESFFRLLQIMRNDPLLNDKIITLLKLDSCERQSILNYWLAQLDKQKSCENLHRALSCLCDDKVSTEMLKVLNN